PAPCGVAGDDHEAVPDDVQHALKPASPQGPLDVGVRVDHQRALRRSTVIFPAVWLPWMPSAVTPIASWTRFPVAVWRLSLAGPLTPSILAPTPFCASFTPCGNWRPP